MLKGLDLFSGIGGISLALKPWIKTIAYCECETYPQLVLLERMQKGDLDNAPIWDDIRTLNREILDTEIDIIFGGFPCQDISCAGKKLGIIPESRSGLFHEIMRLACEFDVPYIFLENVPAIRKNGLNIVLGELASRGYNARWTCISAKEIGAPHKRNRWFLLAELADSNGARLQKAWTKFHTARAPRNDSKLATGVGQGLQGLRQSSGIQSEFLTLDYLCDHKFPAGQGIFQYDFEPPRLICTKASEGDGFESKLGGNTDGVSRKLDGNRTKRIKALGNSVTPQAVRKAFKTLIGFKEYNIIKEL